MSAYITQDTPATTVTTLEIEKLKHLVQNLESQNNALRTKTWNCTANTSRVCESGTTTVDDAQIRSAVTTISATPRMLHHQASWLDDVPMLDVGSDSSQDEESSWLYVSPSKHTPACSSTSPYKWIRQDLDEPSLNVKLVRKSLIFTLDEMINAHPTGIARGAANHSRLNDGGAILPKQTTGGAAASTRYAATANAPSIAAGDVESGKVQVDSAARFTETSSSAGGAKNADFIDIQAMARLQEQSLRESFNSIRRASGSSSGSIPQLNLSDLESSCGSNLAGSARSQEVSPPHGNQDTYRVIRSGNSHLTSSHHSPIARSLSPAAFIPPNQEHLACTALAADGNAASHKGAVGVAAPIVTRPTPSAMLPVSRAQGPLPEAAQLGTSCFLSPTPSPRLTASTRVSALPTLSRRSGVPVLRTMASSPRPGE